MQYYLAQVTMGVPTQRHHHPYLGEGQRITKGLQQLPNLKHLTLRRPMKSTTTPASTTVLKYTLRWIQHYYLQLQSLDLELDHCDLECLSQLEDLRMLRFSGYSLTHPGRMRTLVYSLKRLKELHIIGPPPGFLWQQRHGQRQNVVQSMTPEVLRAAPPLSALTICDVVGVRSKRSGSNHVFLVPDMFQALYDRHRDSLQSLDLFSDEALDPEATASLARFMTVATALRHLAVGWPEIDLRLVDCLPRSLRSVEVVVTNRVLAAAFAERLEGSRYRLPYLAKVSVHVGGSGGVM